VAPGALDAEMRAWVRRALGEGGVQVEPWVVRAGDFAQHGHVSAHGEVALGRPCLQRCTADGRWLASELAPPGALSAQESAALEREARRAAAALAEAGYFGPFNVDGFRYQVEGRLGFNARCEINARYTMGWAVGMAGARPDLEEV
jgi:hypothetical protein